MVIIIDQLEYTYQIAYNDDDIYGNCTKYSYFDYRR